jgi:2-phosphosulfolactate phosphatase
MAAALYDLAKPDLYEFMKENQASHYMRLSGYGLQKDLKYCLSEDGANVLPYYEAGRLRIRNAQSNIASQRISI